MSAFRLVCAGCGAPAPAVNVDPYPFRCRCGASLPDTDHVIAKVLGDDTLAWPTGTEDNPFLRYRTLLYSHDVASAVTPAADSSFVELVQHLDDAIFEMCGQRFRTTPFSRRGDLSAALGCPDTGGIWVKDETGNVSGSHKARHLAGIMLYLLQVRDEFSPDPLQELTIASCGNAALASAVVARAAAWPLRTFVPPDANPPVITRLGDLGARLEVCPRRPGEMGDPCYLRFKEALAGGAIPFCCQGPDNGLTIEGGETLAYEVIDQLGDTVLDALVIQVVASTAI